MGFVIISYYVIISTLLLLGKVCVKLYKQLNYNTQNKSNKLLKIIIGKNDSVLYNFCNKLHETILSCIYTYV